MTTEKALQARWIDRRWRGSAPARRLVTSQPVSVVVAGLQIVGFIVFAFLVRPVEAPLHDLRHGVAALFFIQRPSECLIGVAATLILVGVAERSIGRRRSIVAYVVACAVAAGSAVLIRELVQLVLGSAPAGFRVAFVPPYAPAVGAIVVASAFVGPLWRRRIRVLSFAGAAAFVLFEGNFSGLVTLVVAATSLILGIALRRGRLRPHVEWVRSSHNETRVLLSLVVAVSAGGLLAAVLGRTPIGPLGYLGDLFRDPLPAGRLPLACRVAGVGRGADFVVNPFGECTTTLARYGLHTPGAVAVGVAPLLLLVVAAFYIRRGVRVAAVVATLVNALLAIGAILHLLVLPSRPVVGPGPAVALHVFLTGAAAVIPLAITVLLIANRRHTSIARNRRVVSLGVVSIASAAVVLTAAFVAAGMVDESALVAPADFGSLVVTGLERLAPFGFSGSGHLGVVPIGGLSRVLFVNMGWVFWLVAIVSVTVICRRRVTVAGHSHQESLRGLLHRGGGGPLAHMATWHGNEAWFDPADRGAVAYRRIGDVAITLGDPICAAGDSAALIVDFSRWCDDRGALPVFYSADSAMRPVFASMGWNVIPVGEETIIRPRTVTMQGKKWQDVRSSVNRATKADVRAEWTRLFDLPTAMSRQIDEISEEWVADKKRPEMGFTLGGLAELRDAEVRLMLAVSVEGRVEAVTSWLPSYRDDTVVGWTLDFMRRRADSMNGVMEFVIASTILQAQQDDLEFLSLSAAPLVSTSPSATPIDSVLDYLSRSLEPAYGFRSLFAFKKKFQPEYRELIMAYPDQLALPRISAALARAYLPDLSPKHITRFMRSMS